MDAELRALPAPTFGEQRERELLEVGVILNSRRWKYAKSMPETPHEYTMIEWVPGREEEFYRAVETIRRLGERTFFRGWPYIELTIGDHRYWTMGYPVRGTTLINRRLARDSER